MLYIAHIIIVRRLNWIDNSPLQSQAYPQPTDNGGEAAFATIDAAESGYFLARLVYLVARIQTKPFLG
jgi:hypothetical protein